MAVDLTDEALIENFRRTGNITMFQTLVRRYQSRIYTAAFRILSNSEEAEEVVQDTFLKVHQNISKFRQQASFSSWVFKIAHNQCMDILRNRQRRKGFRLLSFDPQSNKPEPTEEAMEAYSVISQLTDPGADPSQSLELSEQGKKYINMTMASAAPTKKQVHTFIDAVEKAEKGEGPVLIHCAHGSDRTGCMIGIWRVTHENWDYDKTYQEMRKYFFTPKFTKLSGAVRQYAEDKSTHVKTAD